MLIFHRVVLQPDELFPAEVDARRFDRICTWLREWFNVLPLEEAVQLLKDGELPARALSITFDDGYADNHDIALPILARHGLSATFFVATGFLNGGRMWNDTVVESIRRTTLKFLPLESLGLTGIEKLNLTSTAQRTQAIVRLLGAIKYLVPAKRDILVSTIARLSQAHLPDNLMMTAGQVRGLHAAGMTIGGHTVSHPILASLDETQALAEILQGQQHLEEILQTRVSLFAYPNGRPMQDYTARDAALVRRAGFDAAVSTAWGAARSDVDPFQLPRFTPWDLTRTRFGLRLARSLSWQYETAVAAN